ncbi:uncharacterized protein MYCFIDRAFT_80353 [Pseudocercospora fijiensis CIRAD86]|uniref:Tat pathway signal sequence n=1 Tax=Pseudocercospora fijiensis (strain CIRAD86) TaxID=383855 RepID=M3AZZ7_PSEFD|nr:uncharacterized protein MYCFIDRAFT_80353 [Pseudocercospora fijiensis CIRAD86]EME82733.1 hypothetical protein MYCFIDRAFT_80353 [Pseudocercospora fijiensis CIRAD86]
MSNAAGAWPWPPDNALRRPASRRISTPVSGRLDRITESTTPTTPTAPPIPQKSVLRNSDTNSDFPTLSAAETVEFPQPGYRYAYKNSTDTSASGTPRTAPPAYEWVPEPMLVDEDHKGPVEGEKLAAFRRSGGHKRQPRGGWKRLALVALAALLLLGLVLGLALGLTVGKPKSNTVAPTPAQPADQQPFPIGSYNMVTALKTVTTNCTSNPETFNCYPYNVYNSADSSSFSTSLTTFGWTITNTSSTYATIGTASTPDEGVPANLTISSSGSPFTVNFTDKALTYISPSSNTSSARYTFSFEMEKAFNPPVSLTSDNTATQCFFNQTTFTGTLYLSAARTLPADQDSSTASNGKQWPYAVDITSSSAGGQDTPACYEYQNGALGARITTGLTPQPTGSECLCEYQNS